MSGGGRAAKEPAASNALQAVALKVLPLGIEPQSHFRNAIFPAAICRRSGSSPEKWGSRSPNLKQLIEEPFFEVDAMAFREGLEVPKTTPTHALADQIGTLSSLIIGCTGRRGRRRSGQLFTAEGPEDRRGNRYNFSAFLRDLCGENIPAGREYS